MGSYSGPALVVDQEGQEHAVDAMLYSVVTVHDLVEEPQVVGLTTWAGTLRGSAPWWDLSEAGEPVELRIGERVGSVFVMNFDLAEPVAPVQVIGSSPPPFD